MPDARSSRLARLVHAHPFRAPIGEPGPQVRRDGVAPPWEGGEPLLLLAEGGGRILEAPVNARRAPRKHRTSFTGVIAHGDDAVPGLWEKRLERLRAVTAEVDAHFVHHPNGQRMHAAGLRPSTVDLQAIFSESAQEALGHLAPGRVVCAENQNACAGPAR